MKPSYVRHSGEIAWLWLICFGAWAQEPPTFEVASVKPSDSRSIRMFSGGPGTKDPGRISWSRATLHDVLYYAFDLKDGEQISGPEWLSTEPYDITAKIPPGTTKVQFEAMLQVLLADRFKMVVHHVTRELAVYFLVVAKNGPKFREPNSETDKEGFPHLSPGRPGLSVNYGMEARLAARHEPLAALAQSLRRDVGRMVIDKTGLDGTFDFTLEYSLRDSTADPGRVPALFDALPQQLGLRLMDGKAPFDVVVVDHAERMPTAN